ncbi:hypothetical protein FSPOR_5598 [Fusarium sporotrichioides]|uniref:Uncharacterized protein n=1 Tax=Fusarium sporotrichioides TaxID=5514 RepID=A0A395S6S0_FUSSP|nr:hypothetical protein FSPOR_5598 [Fusarium sporotrichioides]
MAVENPFTVFPREVRDMIYTYTIQDIKFTNILAHRTAYNPQNAPILYINDAIANDIKHLLYKDHEIVVHLPKPQYYAEAPRGFLSNFQQCSELMKQRSHTFVGELAWSFHSRFPIPTNVDLHDFEVYFTHDIVEDFGLPPESEDPELKRQPFFGDDEGKELGRKFFAELAAVQPALPNLQKVEVNGWIVLWLYILPKCGEPVREYIKAGMDASCQFA